MLTVKHQIGSKGAASPVSPPVSAIPGQGGPNLWRLPSGTPLVEFALRSGFVSPLPVSTSPFWPESGARKYRSARARRPESLERTRES